MNIFDLLLSAYFAAVLGIAGIAKIDSSEFFKSALFYQYKFPRWSVNVLGKIFPWSEILLAILLLFPSFMCRVAASFVTLLLFLVFLFLKSGFYINRDDSNDCSCYGKSLQPSRASINWITVFIQAILAVSLVFMVTKTTPLSQIFYLVSSVLLICTYCWLLWRCWRKRRLIVTQQASLLVFDEALVKEGNTPMGD